MKRTFNFGKIDFYKTGRKINEVEVTIELRNIDKGTEFSAIGGVWNSKKTDMVCGGQCLDTLAEYLIGNLLFYRIFTFWKLYHLNSMHAGTEKQENYLDKLYKENPGKYKGGYVEKCEVLEEAGLLVDNGYKYGSGWLYWPIPKDDLEKIKKLITDGRTGEEI